jgi:hypothetical protein|tara:strand:+ start:4622 stop:6667 length:2046 start_codon:yes stop_codon:yes gene_type:complete
MSKKLTSFQRLNKIFGPAGIKVPQQQTNRYGLGNQEILRTTDPAEADAAKLQAQQTKYLSKQWMKVDGEMYQKAIHYEVTRAASYSDFEAMEFYPEIAATLDIMMEEATTPNDKGKVMNIYSDSKRVRTILEDLFFNRLDLHTNLPMWTRNTCKYGDDFVYLNIDDKAGIIGARQMPNFEMERIEGDLHSLLKTAHANGADSLSVETSEYDNKTKFLWRPSEVEFDSWQIAHFRLLGDDRKLPYGTSVLEKARRIWKQLLLAEDAMLIYRVTRAPERRVYKIYVGNIDDKDVPAYVDEIASKFKRTPVIDPQTGQIDSRYNQMAVDEDFFIPVRDENAQTPIDILQGAQNLDAIADIEHLQRKLFTALRVPKSFLGYEEAQGDGKNLSLQDIRFARTVNRIQQAMIQELNKVAIIHLYLLGFEDELDNFTLTLNNPSTQAEMLKVEQLQQKITLYADAVKDAGNGFAPMSMTKAMKDILGYSDDEIREVLLQQRMEKAAAAELEQSAKVIKHTGVFDVVDNIYGDPNYDPEAAPTEGEDGGDGDAAGGGGGFGGGGFSGEDLDFGDGDGEGEDGGDEAELNFDTTDDEGGDPVEADESQIRNAKNLINEKKKVMKESLDSKKLRYNSMFKTRETDHMTRLINSFGTPKQEYVSTSKVFDKSLKINEGIDKMIGDLGETLGD